MCAIFVDIYILYFFTIDISPEMVSLINYEAAFSCFISFEGKCRAKQSRAYYEIIVWFHTMNYPCGPLTRFLRVSFRNGKQKA